MTPPEVDLAILSEVAVLGLRKAFHLFGRIYRTYPAAMSGTLSYCSESEAITMAGNCLFIRDLSLSVRT